MGNTPNQTEQGNQAPNQGNEAKKEVAEGTGNSNSNNSSTQKEDVSANDGAETKYNPAQKEGDRSGEQAKQ